MRTQIKTFNSKNTAPAALATETAKGNSIMFQIKSRLALASKQLRAHVFAKSAILLLSLSLLPTAEANVIGNVDNVGTDGVYPHLLFGWACSVGLNQSINVQIYAGGPAGTGTLVGTFKADSSSEPGVATACATQGANYRFKIPLTTIIRKQFAGQRIYVHGVSPIGEPNTLLTSTYVLSVPVLSTVSVTRTYVYDDKQRLCKSIEPETRATVYDYDAAGNVIWSASGQELMGNVCDRASVSASEKTTYAYDAMNRVISVTYPDGTNNTTSTYEADGKLKTVVSNGSTWNFEYNKRRLLTKETLNFYSNYSNTYGYSANGHLATYTTNNGTVVDYAPNALGQPTQASGYATNVQYHPNGSMKQFTYGNGIVYTMTQNARQLPDISTYKLGVTKIAEFDLNFDPNGNVVDNLDLAQAGHTDRSMAYDGLDRLTQAYAPNMWGMANYQYDALDNLRRSTLGLAGFNYYYDSNNHVNRIDRDVTGNYAYTFDASGNVLSDGRNSYAFTRANRLAAITGIETYQYDGFGRRVVSWRQDGTAVVPVYGQDGVLRYDADNKKGGGTTHVQLNGSQIAEHFKRWSDGVTTITYNLTDALGSPVATTDTIGGVLDRIEYAPFGAPFNRPVDGVGYTGHVMDQATGLVYAQQRYYDPMIGRFLSADPMPSDVTNGWNFNRYNYAANNPYAFTDPDGREIADYINALLGRSPSKSENHVERESLKAQASQIRRQFLARVAEAKKVAQVVLNIAHKSPVEIKVQVEETVMAGYVGESGSATAEIDIVKGAPQVSCQIDACITPGVGLQAGATGNVVLEFGNVASKVNDTYSGLTFEGGEIVGVAIDIDFSDKGAAVSFGGGAEGGAKFAAKVCKVVKDSCL